MIYLTYKDFFCSLKFCCTHKT